MTSDQIFILLKTLLISITSLTALFIFKKPISSFIEKIVQLTFKKNSGSNSLEIGVKTDTTSIKFDLPEITQEQNHKSTEIELIEEDTDYRFRIYDLLRTNKPDEAKSLYNEALGKTVNNEKEFELKMFYAHFSYQHGFDKEMKNFDILLVENSMDDKRKIQILVSMSRCYLNFDQYFEVENINKRAKQISINNDDLIQVYLLEGECLFKRFSKSKAHEHYFNLINNIKFSDESYYLLYKEIGSLYKEDNKYLYFVAMCKALSYKPSSRDDLFNIAFNTDIDKYALYYYTKLLAQVSNHEYALNNIGVLYNKLNLKSKSISSYNKSSELNNTLAMANIAKIYIDNGFIEKARELLINALEKKEVHQNIHHYLSTIGAVDIEEQKKEDEILEDDKHRIEFINNNVNLFLSEANIINISGKYKDDIGNIIDVNSNSQGTVLLTYFNSKDTYSTIIDIKYYAFETKLSKNDTSYILNDELNCIFVFNNQNQLVLFVSTSNNLYYTQTLSKSFDMS